MCIRRFAEDVSGLLRKQTNTTDWIGAEATPIEVAQNSRLAVVRIPTTGVGCVSNGPFAQIVELATKNAIAENAQLRTSSVSAWHMVSTPTVNHADRLPDRALLPETLATMRGYVQSLPDREDLESDEPKCCHILQIM